MITALKSGGRFNPPKTFSSILNIVNKAQVFVSTPSKSYNSNAEKLDAPAYGKKVEKVVDLLTKDPLGVKVTTQKYDRTITEAESNKFTRKPNGKKLIKYTSNQLDKNFESQNPQKAIGEYGLRKRSMNINGKRLKRLVRWRQSRNRK